MTSTCRAELELRVTAEVAALAEAAARVPGPRPPTEGRVRPAIDEDCE